MPMALLWLMLAGGFVVPKLPSHSYPFVFSSKLLAPTIAGVLGINRKLCCSNIQIATVGHAILPPSTGLALLCGITLPCASILIVAIAIREVVDIVVNNLSFICLIPVEQQISHKHATTLLLRIFCKSVLGNGTATTLKLPFHRVV